jgi:hypothetical protein
MRKALTTEKFQENVNTIFGADTYTVISEYTKSSGYISIKHSKCGNTFDIVANDFTKESKRARFYDTCPACRTSKRSPLDKVKEDIRIATKDRLLLLEYGGTTHTPSKFKCKICNYDDIKISTHSLLGNLKSRSNSNSWGCAVCSKKKQKTTQEFNKEIDQLFNGNIALISEYVNVGTYVSLKCNKCTYEWNTMPSTILGGSQCPACLRSFRDSKQIRRVIEFLDKYEVPFEREVTFEGLVYKKQLYFDFCIETEDTYFLIEFDGQQHFRGWQGNEDNLNENQIRDNIKNDFCKDNDLPLLRLHYKMTLSEIDKAIYDFLFSPE